MTAKILEIIMPTEELGERRSPPTLKAASRLSLKSLMEGDRS